MSKPQLKKAARAISNLTTEELLELHDQISTQLEERITETAAYDTGWDDCIALWWSNVQEVNDRFYTLGTVINYAHGIATAGYGDVPANMMRQLAGKIADAATQLELEVDRIEYHTGADLGLDLTWAIENKDAIKAMYSGADPQGDRLRQLAAGDNTDKQHNVLAVRPQHQPGRKRLSSGQRKQTPIDKLCQMAKPLRESGMTWGEIVDRLQYDMIERKTPEAGKLFSWADPVDSLKKAYSTRYGE